MYSIYRIKINDNDPTIMDEDEIMEDIYEKTDELSRKLSYIIDILSEKNDPTNDNILDF